MAIWWKALALVPWVDVVKNAPQVVEGARKLWQSVARRGGGPDQAAPTAVPVPVGTDADAIGALSARVAELEREMKAASELIRSLAEQDGQLVAQVALLQRQRQWLGRGLVLVALAAVTALVMHWTR